MSRRCHHGSPRHARPPGRDRRRGAILADRTTPPNQATDVSPAAPDAADDPAVLEGESIEELTSRPFPDGLGSGAAGIDPSASTDSVAPVASVVPPTGPKARSAQLLPGSPVGSLIAASAAPAAAALRDRGMFRGAPSSAAGASSTTGEHAPGEHAPGEHGATAPQLRRFIKSRAYVPMHELRRRFAINGGDDDVTPLEVDRQRVYVGLPEREGRLLGELLKGGDIGVELSLDPIAPIVVGVYPMRPIPRT